MDHHGEKCVAAAQAADAVSSNAAEGGASALAGAASNVMDLMMRLRNVKAAQECQGSRCGRQQGRTRGRAGKGLSGERGSGFGASDEKTTDLGFLHQKR